MLESKFQQLAQQQILLAMAKMREENEASFTREISSLNLAHSETLKSLQEQLNVDMKKQLILIKQVSTPAGLSLLFHNNSLEFAVSQDKII
jgi:hypothetical protein